MDRAALEAAEKKLRAIRGAEEMLVREQEKLRLFNALVPSDKVFKTTFMLKKGSTDYNNITADIILPRNVLQQQLIYAVAAARRAVILAGGLA